MLFERVKEDGPGPRISATPEADERRPANLVDVALGGADHEIGPARHAQPPQRLQLGAPHEGPRLLLGAGDERAARGDVPLLLQAQRGGLPHAGILILERGAQHGPRIGGRAGVLQIAELAGGQVAQDGIVGDRLRRGERLRARIPLRRESSQRHHGTRAQLERAVGAEDAAQGGDRLRAALRRPLDRHRQDARQVGRPRRCLVVGFGRRLERRQHRLGAHPMGAAGGLHDARPASPAVRCRPRPAAPSRRRRRRTRPGSAPPAPGPRPRPTASSAAPPARRPAARRPVPALLR